MLQLLLLLACGSSWKGLDQDGDGFAPSDGDCWDALAGPTGSGLSGAEIHPGADDPSGDGIDQGCDGGLEFDGDGDGYDNVDRGGEDCDDEDPAINPGAQEVCGGVDEDCDGLVDDEDSSAGLGSWYRDADGDGWGNEGAVATATSCEVPDSYSMQGGDCDDADAEINPDAEERCDELDQDCDGGIDEGAVDATIWHPDADEDGYGANDREMDACEAPEGYLEDGQDCDDTNEAIHPGATETCDKVDEDCDGEEDDYASDAQDFYADADDDGYGSLAILEAGCEAPDGYVSDPSDCDDADADINPGAVEICDGADNDCDDLSDDADPSLDTSTATTWYEDNDGDGFGLSSISSVACDLRGYAGEAGDCNDDDPTAYPGAGVEEECGDGDREDCDIGDETAREECIGGDPSRSEADAIRYGSSASRELAETLASAGDVDGDGLDDLLVAAPSSGGGVYLLAGALERGGLALSASTSYTAFLSDGSSTELGRGLAGGEDLDVDGYDDVGMGAPNGDSTYANAGVAYIAFGPLSDAGVVSDSDVSITGAASSQYVGYGLSMGEVSDDGQADLIIGAPGYKSGSSSNVGAVYVLMGPLSAAELTLGSDYDTRITGDESLDRLGKALAAVGDVDGDGAGDLWVGSPTNGDGGGGAGQAELLLGPVESGAAGDSAALTFRGGSVYAAGTALAGPGDVNGDGYADLLVAAPGYDDDSGLVALLLGSEVTELSLSMDEDDADTIFLGASSSDALGTSVSGALDLEGDGLGDLALGAPGYDEAASGAGAVWLISGLSEGSFILGDGEGALILGGDTDEALGTAVSGLGDTDGDGWDDLVVGAPGYDIFAASDVGALFLFARWY